MELGERIYRLRTAKGLSQEGLAERLGVTRQSVSKWETEAAVPDLERLMGLCDVFGVTLDELTGRVEREGSDKVTTFTPLVVPQPVPQAKIVGYILLVLSLLGGLLLLLFQQMELLMMVVLPMLLCSVICLSVRRHAGYWCLWVIWGMVEFLLTFGITLLIGTTVMPWVRVVALAGMGVVVWRTFREVTVKVSPVRGGLAVLGWVAYVGLLAAAQVSLRSATVSENVGTRMNMFGCVLVTAVLTAALAGVFTYTVCLVRSWIAKQTKR